MTIDQIKEHNITNEEIERICQYTDGLSDLDRAWDPETGDYTLFAIEWDGNYGRHWEYFKTEEDREATLMAHSARQIEMLPMVRQELAEEAEAAKQAAIEKGLKKKALREARTLGGQHEILAVLLVQMRNDRWLLNI